MLFYLSSWLWEPEPLCFVHIGMAFQSLQIGTKKAAFSVPPTRGLKGRTPAELDPVHPFNDLAGFLKWWWANSMKLPHISFCWAMWSQRWYKRYSCMHGVSGPTILTESHGKLLIPDLESQLQCPRSLSTSQGMSGVSFSTNLWFVQLDQLDLSSLTLLVVVHSPGDADDFLQTTYSTKVYESPFLIFFMGFFQLELVCR